MRRIFIMLAFVCSSASTLAQFNAVLYTTEPFRSRCYSNCWSYIPDGPSYVVIVFWDSDNNGPDYTDEPAPDAVQNYYSLNGGEYLGVPGAFYTDPLFTYNSYTPNPSRFYVRIYSSQIYESDVFTIPSGYSEHDLTGTWHCVGGAPCLSDDASHFYSDPFTNPLHVCLKLCAFQETLICFRDRTVDERPVISIVPFTPDCAEFGDCSPNCCPASFEFDDAAWFYYAPGAMWCNWINPSTYGCVCVTEQILPVEYGAFEALPRNRAVLLQWSTASEHEVAEFRLFRDGDQIHQAAATNSVTGGTYEFLDRELTNGTTYVYSLVVANLDGSLDPWPSTASAMPGAEAAVVTEYALQQNYPNPFNASTNLVFDVVAENHVNLIVHNTTGQVVARLVDGAMPAGHHTVSFDAANLTSGLYFYTVKIGNEFTATKKMLLVK